jgi:hypothetical protein
MRLREGARIRGGPGGDEGLRRGDTDVAIAADGKQVVVARDDVPDAGGNRASDELVVVWIVPHGSGDRIGFTTMVAAAKRLSQNWDAIAGV